MEYLLDTHTFLWFINGDAQLSKKAREEILRSKRAEYGEKIRQNSDGRIFLSMWSIHNIRS